MQRASATATLLALLVSVSCATGNVHDATLTAPYDAEYVTEARVAAAEDGVLAPVVIVTLDGVRWQEIFLGTDPVLSGRPVRPPRAIAPNLDRLAREEGTGVGAPGRSTIRASGPNFVSLPGYVELLGGRAALHCQDNDCRGAVAPTLLDEALSGGAKVAAFGSWERLARAVTMHTPPRFTVSCGRGDDDSIEPYPGSGGFRPDRFTAEASLAYLTTERPDVLFVGLGEPDEYAHRRDYAGYVAAITFADAFIGRLRQALDAMGDRGRRTHLFVTADHGRAGDFADHGGFAPESGRVWLVASGPSFASRGLTFGLREHFLADVVPTARVVLGLSPDPSARAGTPIAEMFGP